MLRRIAKALNKPSAEGVGERSEQVEFRIVPLESESFQQLAIP